MLIAFKFGLLFKQIKPFYATGALTESIEIKSKEEEQLYKSDVIAITQEDNIVRIYINTEENKDLLYYVTIIESTLRDKKFDASTIIFEIIIDNEVVDAFSIKADTIHQLLDTMNKGAIKIEEADKSSINTLKKFKLENNKVQRMIMLKGELFPVNKNEAMSSLMQNAIKHNEKSIVSKIKEVFFDNTFTPIAKYIRAVFSFNKTHNLEHLVVQGDVKLENILYEYTFDRPDNNRNYNNPNYNNRDYNNRNNNRDYNNRNDNRPNYNNNDRNRDNYRNNTNDKDHYRNRNNDHNRHSYKPNYRKPDKKELSNLQKTAIAIALSSFIVVIGSIYDPNTMNIIGKLLLVVALAFGIKLLMDATLVEQKEKQFLHTLTPKYEYHLA